MLEKINQNDWICSQPQQNHRDMVMCNIINSKEDQLFSGSRFKQEQIDLLLLIKKTQCQISFAVDKDSIILWERNQNNKFEFKYVFIIAEILKILSNNKKLNSYLLTNSSINSQFKLKDQNLSLQKIHSLYGQRQQGVRNQIKYGCLNQRKEFFKKKSKKLLIQAEIIKLLMNFFFQQFTINRGISYSQDIKQSYM
ncbi:unnamed protein product [Paramecium sonneborni]|uniref:Uncharacterized protein n=1 Tax=Paramecium sonneborni TaxID=65129 RepID=A0A8S1RS01_9CILI|nr:unnamed protein product [Paramecium sonneborni]